MHNTKYSKFFVRGDNILTIMYLNLQQHLFTQYIKNIFNLKICPYARSNKTYAILIKYLTTYAFCLTYNFLSDVKTYYYYGCLIGSQS